MKKVSICFVAEKGYWEAIHSFESIGFAIKEKQLEFIIKDAPKEYIKTIGDIEVELFVIDKTKDERTTEYFVKIANYVRTEEAETIAEMYNDVFRLATGDYICIIPTGLFLQENWLMEFIFHYCNVAKGGVVGILSDFDKAQLSSLVSADGENFINVFVPKSQYIEGICFFDRQHLYIVGAFDQSASLVGNELNQFCARCTAGGLYNYYLPTASCVYINDREQANKESLQASLLEMRKARNFYLPL